MLFCKSSLQFMFAQLVSSFLDPNSLETFPPYSSKMADQKEVQIISLYALIHMMTWMHLKQMEFITELPLNKVWQLRQQSHCLDCMSKQLPSMLGRFPTVLKFPPLGRTLLWVLIPLACSPSWTVPYPAGQDEFWHRNRDLRPYPACALGEWVFVAEPWWRWILGNYGYLPLFWQS